MKTFEPDTQSFVIPPQLGKRIMEIMEEKGKAFTQQALANRIGMNRVTLSKKLHGERELYLFELRRIADALHLPLERLLQEDTIDDARELEECFTNLDNFPRALELAEYISSLSVGITERGKSLNDLGRAFYYLRRYDEAYTAWKQCFQFAKEISEKYGDSDLLLKVVTNLMLTYTVRKEYSNLSEMISQIEPKFYDDPARAAIICYSLALIAENRGNIEEARGYYFKTLQFNESLNAKNDLAKAWHNMATFEYRQGNYEIANHYFEKALPALMDDPQAAVLCIKEHCKVLLKLNKAALAEHLIQLALSLPGFETVSTYPVYYAKLHVLLATATNNPIFAEKVLHMENLDDKNKSYAGRFLFDFYDMKDDSTLAMHYYRIVRKLSKGIGNIIDEEDF